MEVVSNDSCTNDNEIKCDVVEEVIENGFVELTFEPEIEIPPQPIDRHETIENVQPTPQPEATVEETVVHEVSFQSTQLNTKSKKEKKI